MKKLSILVLLTAAVLFFSCSQPASSGSTNNKNSSDNSGKKSSTETTDTVTDTETNTISETDNGLTSNFTAPTLPEGGNIGTFAGKTFGTDSAHRIVFGNDGTYTLYDTEYYESNHSYKNTQQKVNYTCKDVNGEVIMYQTLHSYNDIISERNDMMTYQDLFNYFNTFPYETFHAANPNATPEQFRAAVSQALENYTNEYFAPVKMSKVSYVEGDSTTPGVLHISPYYSQNDSITTSQIKFKYNHGPNASGTVEIGNRPYSSWKGILPIKVNNKIESLEIISISDSIITTKGLSEGTTLSFHWEKELINGVIYLTITADDSTEYLFDSLIESTIPEIPNP